MVERRLGLAADLEPFDRLELVSLDESREETTGDETGATGR